MNKNLKIALIRRSSEQGFAIPTAVGLGLFMILTAATMIVRSQGDQVTASAQKTTNRSLSAAETGITRYQTLINNNRAIAIYKDCDGTRDSNGVCSDTGTTKSWANATKIPGITGIVLPCNGSGGASNVIANSTIAWQDVSASDPSLGQYRLVSYVYPAPGTTGTPGVVPGIGQLTVEGRVNQVGSGSTATKGLGTATTRLQVNIPVQEGNYPDVPFPGMWVNTSLNTGTTKANVLVRCNNNPTVSIDSGYKVSKSDSPMPNLPNKPTTKIYTINPTGKSLPENPSDLNNFNSNTGEYQYSVSQINDTFTIKPGYKVAIYLDGNIELQGGQAAIIHQCGSTPNCKPTDARIYGLKADGTFSLGGNPATCDILFFAPTYAVTLNGGGGAQGCGGGANNNGIFWVKSWNGGGNGSHVSLHQTSATWKDVSFLIPVPPQIAPITSWQRQEVAP